MADATPNPSDKYVVVARRYRPQTFDSLIGQSHIAKALTGAISADRVGHAYLFTGARGVGKTSAARILAKALNCLKGTSPVPCNECEVCLSISTGDDVDVLEIDGASNRGIDEIRQLRQNAEIRPSRVRYKIYIIDEVHMLTREAFNALLKTLEEPPPHVKFIFATTEPHKVPVTILSRCQRFDFAGIDTQKIEERLAQIAEAEEIAAEPEALAILARRAAGSMRDGQSLLEQIMSGCEGSITTDAVVDLLGIAPAAMVGTLAQHLVAKEAASALALLDNAIAKGIDVGMLLEQLHGYFRDTMVLSVGCEPAMMRYALPAEAEIVQNLGTQLGTESILCTLQILDQAVARLRLGVDVRTLVEMAIVRICRLEDLDAISTLIAELRGMPSGTSATTTRPTLRPKSTPDSKKNVVPNPHSLNGHGGNAPTQAPALQREALIPTPASVETSSHAVSTNAVVAPTINALSPTNIAAAPVLPETTPDVAKAELHDAPEHHPEHKTASELLTAVSAASLVSEARLPTDNTNQAKEEKTQHVSRREIRQQLSQNPFVVKAMNLFNTDASQLSHIPRKKPK